MKHLSLPEYCIGSSLCLNQRDCDHFLTETQMPVTAAQESCKYSLSIQRKIRVSAKREQSGYEAFGKTCKPTVSRASAGGCCLVLSRIWLQLLPFSKTSTLFGDPRRHLVNDGNPIWCDRGDWSLSCHSMPCMVHLKGTQLHVWECFLSPYSSLRC